MLSSTRLIAFFLLTVAVQAFAGSQIYRYKDDSGTVNFTNELYSIPEKYRAGAVALMPETPSPLEKPKGPPAIREIRSYTAGIVTVLNQRTSTRLEDGAIIIHVDLTAQVDQDEVILAIHALRENESATLELASLRTETEQLRQRLDTANQALTVANTAEQVHALTLQRQQVLNQMQADALVAQALAGYAYVTPAKVHQINELLHRARQIHPSNPHLPAAEQSASNRMEGLSPSAQMPVQGSQPAAPATFPPASSQSPLATPLPQSPLATPLPPSPLATPLPQSPLATPLPQSPLATPLPHSPLAKPLGPSPLAAPLGPSPLAAPLR